MFFRSQVMCGLALLALGIGLAVLASGCEDGCVRNSDCASGFVCGDGVCVIDLKTDGGLDSSVDAADEDAGR